MKYYKVSTVGCKVAQYEGQQVRTLLERFGLVDAGSRDPDICVANTCAVTATAASKSRRSIRALARKYPAARLVVLGCYVSLADRSIREIPQLALLADHGQGILPALRDFLAGQLPHANHWTITNGSSPHIGTCNNTNIETHTDENVKDYFAAYGVKEYADRHRAVLKVQDGCDANCSYCAIPVFRPTLNWSTRADVLTQARRYIEVGHREIVVSGVFLGAYGRSTAKRSRLSQPGQPLVDLIDELARLPGLGRLRLSSLEPGDVTDRLIETIAGNDRLVQHLHLPLQSGSNGILKRMGRQYTTQQYLRAVGGVRERLPELAITTDIITGFPGETEEDVQATVDVACQVGFARMHVFPFSPRPQTAAYRWRSDLPPKLVVRERCERVRTLAAELAGEFCARFVGKTVRVLVEKQAGTCQTDETWCVGRADQYFPVRFAADGDLDNRLVSVRVDRVDPAGPTAEGRLEAVIDD